MWPVLGGLISGGASLLGSMFSADTSAQNSQIAAQTSLQNNQQQIGAQQGMLNQTEQFNAGQATQAENFSADQAEIQRGYETQMSNTAYQRASADMKAAGLNPAAMYNGGSPASTPSVSSPSGVSASVGTPTVPQAQFAPPQKANPFAGIGDAVGRAVNSAVSMTQMDKMTEEIANLKVASNKMEAETATEKEKPSLVNSQEGLNRLDMGLKHLAYPQAEFNAKSAGDLSNIPQGVRNALNIGAWGGNKLSDIIAPITESAQAVSRFFRPKLY